MNFLCIQFVILATIQGVWSGSLSTRADRSSKTMRISDDEGYDLTSENELTLSRQKRTFSFFTFVTLPNGQCKYDETRNGTCMTSTECNAAGGQYQDFTYSCGRQQGTTLTICCLLHVTCGDKLSSRPTNYFSNPSYPNYTESAMTCELQVPIQTTCYLRIDFFNFTMHEPVNGSCVVDQMFIPELNLQMPMLCGYNNNTHVYLQVQKLPSITIVINLGEWQGPRRWQMRITRLLCGDPDIPEAGCLQQFPDATGSIRSFNYHEQNVTKSSLISGLDYTVCLRRAANRCYVKWTAQYFQMSKANGTALQGDQCQHQSRIVVPNAYDAGSRDVTFDRFCGEKFSAIRRSNISTNVYTNSFPFTMRVLTNRRYQPEGKGFRVSFSQLQCIRIPVSNSFGKEAYSSKSWLSNFNIWDQQHPIDEQLVDI